MDFDWHDHWATLPDHVTLGYTHGIARSTDGRVFVFNQSQHALLVLDPDGVYLTSWGEDFAAGAHGLTLATDAEGEYLLLTDYERGEVVRASLDGEIQFIITAPRVGDLYDDASAFKPTETSVASDGTIYVADGYGKPWIHIYAPDGSYRDSFGGPSGRTFSRCAAWEDPGSLAQPHGVTLADLGHGEEVIVADRRHNRLQVFDRAGTFQRFIHGGVRYPCSVNVHQGLMYVPDLYSCVHVLQTDGTPVMRIGDQPQAWDLPGWPNVDDVRRPAGMFVAPHACHVDDDGSLLVVEWHERGRIVRLERVD